MKLFRYLAVFGLIGVYSYTATSLKEQAEPASMPEIKKEHGKKLLKSAEMPMRMEAIVTPELEKRMATKYEAKKVTEISPVVSEPMLGRPIRPISGDVVKKIGGLLEAKPKVTILKESIATKAKEVEKLTNEYQKKFDVLVDKLGKDVDTLTNLFVKEGKIEDEETVNFLRVYTNKYKTFEKETNYERTLKNIQEFGELAKDIGKFAANKEYRNLMNQLQDQIIQGISKANKDQRVELKKAFYTESEKFTKELEKVGGRVRVK